jgi:hypothetical protein
MSDTDIFFDIFRTTSGLLKLNGFLLFVILIIYLISRNEDELTNLNELKIYKGLYIWFAIFTLLGLIFYNISLNETDEDKKNYYYRKSYRLTLYPNIPFYIALFFLVLSAQPPIQL